MMHRFCVLAVIGAMLVRAGGPAPAASLTLAAGAGTVIDCPGGVTRVSTSNPEVVDAVVASEAEVLFHAKNVGQATLVVWAKNGQRSVFQVKVEPDSEPLRKLLSATFPDEEIDVQATRDSVALVGRASSQAVADRALALATASFKAAVSALRVSAPPPERQILLRVRFAELNRAVTTEFGFNLISTGAARTPGAITTGQFPSGTASELNGSGVSKFTLSDVLNIFAFRPDLNLGVFMRDLQSRGLLQILAEPNLVATDGKEASFLAGGEFPVPIAQSGANAGAITVQFREFGIRLTFLPRMTPYRSVRLHVRPEVSTIDPSNGVTVSGFRIPALSTRRVETDIELAEGQSFVIAGLLDERVTQDMSRIMGLADIPLFGALFRSHNQTKAKTELIIGVTPEPALPVSGTAPIPAMPVPFLQEPKR
jgi:pilus assembly protein CpaC